jgi:Recombination endonuclease VII/HNH endonuclease
VETTKLTLQRLKEAVSYDPETGEFLWAQKGRGIRTGRPAGSTDKGYRIIVIDGVGHYAQRLAWFWVHGAWPRLIRFQNGNQLDCRIDNLREGFYVNTKYDFRTKEGRAAYQVEYRGTKRGEFVAKERERKFGVTMAQYCEMLLAQEGKCAICRQPETEIRNGRVKTLAVDHCHETGTVRGLLCVQCNTGIGKFKDDRNRLLAAIKYLDKHSGREAAKPALTLVPSEDSK